MAHCKRIWAAVAIAVAALVSFVSCSEKDELETKSHNAGLSLLDEPTEKDEYLETIVKATDEFIEGRREMTVQVIDIYKTPEGDPKQHLVLSEGYSYAPTVYGEETLYGDYDGQKYGTIAEGIDVSRAPMEDYKHFRRELVTTTAGYPLVSEDGKTRYHDGFVSTDQDVTFVYYSEKDHEDKVVEFGVSKQQWSEKTVPSDEENVPHDGAFWSAERYLSTATVNFIGASEYAKGDPCTLTAQNVTFLLKHKVEPRLLPGGYDAEFYTNQLKLLTRKQTYKFQIAQYDNGKLVGDPVSYSKDYNLYLWVYSVNDIRVDKEELLWGKNGKFNWGSLSDQTLQDGIFTITKYDQTGTYVLDDEQVIDLVKHWESGAWGLTKFPYAEISNVTAMVDVKENPNRTTDKQKVTTVTVIFTIYLNAKGSDKTFDPFTIAVQYDRIYQIPDNYTTKTENFKYEFDGKVSEDKHEFVATKNRNSWNVNTYNNGVYVSGEDHSFDLILSIEASDGNTVSIKNDQRGKKVPATVDRGTSSTKDVAIEGEDGYVQRISTQTFTINAEDGSKHPVIAMFGMPLKDGQKVLSWMEISNVRVVAGGDPVKKSSSEEGEAYEVEYTCEGELVEKGGAQTRASGDTRTVTFVVKHEQVYGDDEYVPGKDREVWTVTPNGNGYDIKGQKFETYTLSGEQKVDEKTGSVKFSIVGKNGSVKTVQNVNYQTSGNGWSGTGTMTYRDNASNNVSEDSFQNEYEVSADGKLTLTLKGKNGQDVSKTFSPLLTLTEGGQNITTTGSTSTYTSYNYTNKVNAVYALEGKEVSASATASRELRVKKPIEVPDLVPGKILSADLTCVPAHGDNASNYVDGNNKQNAIKCICIVTNEGAVAVPFAAWDNDNIVVPTESEIKSGNFVSGNYTSDYNSGWYNQSAKKWVPAVAKDEKEAIVYRVNGAVKRSIRNETMKQWDWRNGNYSVYVNGYNFDVDNDGVLTVRYNGEIVLQCK